MNERPMIMGKQEKIIDNIKEETFCVLCLNVLNDGNFTLVEKCINGIIDIVFPTPSAEIANGAIMCGDCSVKLFAAFDFKTKCVETEDCIFPYINPEKEVDLKEVYLDEIGEEHLNDLSEDDKICRLCMQVVSFGFTLVEDIEFDMIQKCIPEINFGSTKEPVICAACLDSLNTHSSFLKNCLNVEEQIKNFQYDKDSLSFIKEEKFEIKYEESEHDSADDGCTEALNRCNSPQNSAEVDNNKYFFSEHGSTLSCFQIINNNVQNVYEYDTSSHKTEDNRNCKKDLLTHKDNSETKVVFECDSCDFKTKYKKSLNRHELLLHRNISERGVFECDECDFKTKYKNSLKQHQLRHKDFSETEIFECGTCDYKTKQKVLLKCHQLKHKSVSETKVFECDTCDYRCMYKSTLKQHQLTHKDISETEVFQCDTCDYKTKYKFSLKVHQLSHKDICETEAFECDACDYKTKRKGNLKKHQLKHKTISETRVFECDTCGYKTKRKSCLKSHLLKHKNMSETEVFACDLCDFKTKRKASLKFHLLKKHKDVSETETFQSGDACVWSPLFIAVCY